MGSFSSSSALDEQSSLKISLEFIIMLMDFLMQGLFMSKWLDFFSLFSVKGSH